MLVSPSTWCLWLRDSYPELALRSLVQCTYFAIFCLKQLVAVVIAIISAVITFLSELYSLLPFVLYGLFAFFWWFWYPELQPYVSTVGVQLLNLALQVFRLFWNLAIILWNLAVMVWNAAAPIIGMILYVALEVLTKLLTAVVQILGSIDVYALFRPFIEILEVVTRMMVEVIQALVSAAMSLLQALAKIIGALITVVVSVVKILFPIVKWVVGLLFKLLFPVLKVVISIVSWFLNFFNMMAARRSLLALSSVDAVERAYARLAFVRDQLNAHGSATPLFARRLHSFADADMEGGAFAQGWSSLHDSMYPSVNWAASRHFSNEASNRAADTELQVMLRIMDETQLHDFSYYWIVNRPILMRIDGGAMPADVYTGEVGTTADARKTDFAFAQFVPHAPSGRALLEFTAARNLLSKEDHEVLSREEPLSADEYWRRFDSADGRESALAWYSHVHYEHQFKRQRAMQRLRDVIRTTRFDSEAEYYEHFSDGTMTVAPSMSYEEFKRLQEDVHEADRIAVGLPPRSRKRAHAFADDLDARHPCKSAACGGEGHTLPHAVHTLRRLSHKRQRHHEQMSWRPPSMTQEEYEKSRMIHVHVVGHAANEAMDTLKWHLQNPHLHQHVRNAWKRVTGYEDVGQAFDAYHRHYRDPGEWMLSRIGSLSDWMGFRWLAERDPEFESRPWFGDWARREHNTQEGAAAFHTRRLNALGENMSGHRRLLELEPRDAEYYQHWFMRKPLSDINAFFTETVAPVPNYAEVAASRRRRELNALPFDLPDVPDAYERLQESKDRQAAIDAQKPQPKAKLPLFELLTQTDCFTTTPRNPLCLPMIPPEYQINEIPEVVWPPEATADDSFCAPTFKRVDRCLTCWKTYVNLRWVYNAIQIPRLILSSIPVFTNTLYQLGQTYPFLRWLFQLPLAKPLGSTPSSLDYVCIMIYAPVSLLFTFLYLKVLSLLWPIVEVMLEGFGELLGLNTTLAASNAAFWQSMQERDTLAIQIAMKDSPYNPSLYMTGNYARDPNFFFRGFNGRAPSHLSVGTGGDAALFRNQNPASVMPGGPQSQQVPGSPYTPEFPPRPEVVMQRNAPYRYSPEEGTSYYGYPGGTNLPAPKNLEASVAGAAKSEAAPDPSDLHRRIAEEQDKLVHGLRTTMARAFLQMGVPRIEPTHTELHGAERVSLFRRAWDWFTDERATTEDLARFEQSYHTLLLPFQDSLLWWLQHRHHSRRRWWHSHTQQPLLTARRIAHFMVPMEAPTQRLEDIALQELVRDFDGGGDHNV